MNWWLKVPEGWRQDVPGRWAIITRQTEKLVFVNGLFTFVNCCCNSVHVKMPLCGGWMWQDGQAPRFSHIAAMYSELLAVNMAGQLCQWRWFDPEPFVTNDVCSFALLTLHLNVELCIFNVYCIFYLHFSCVTGSYQYEYCFICCFTVCNSVVCTW